MLVQELRYVHVYDCGSCCYSIEFLQCYIGGSYNNLSCDKYDVDLYTGADDPCNDYCCAENFNYIYNKVFNHVDNEVYDYIYSLGFYYLSSPGFFSVQCFNNPSDLSTARRLVRWQDRDDSSKSIVCTFYLFSRRSVCSIITRIQS
jgi:hypothetical protein